MFDVYLFVFVFTCLYLCLQREDDLSDLIMKVIKQGLEGLVLKDTKVSNIPVMTSLF